MRILARFLQDEDGTTSVEYSVMLAMIIGIAIVGVRSFGSVPAGSWNNSANQLSFYMGGS